MKRKFSDDIKVNNVNDQIVFRQSSVSRYNHMKGVDRKQMIIAENAMFYEFKNRHFKLL